MTDIRQRAQQIADKHDNDAYSVALELAGHENEIRGLKKQLHDEIQAVKKHADKIKAETVRIMRDHENELENQND